MAYRGDEFRLFAASGGIFGLLEPRRRLAAHSDAGAGAAAAAATAAASAASRTSDAVGVFGAVVLGRATSA